ncbi:hypothetical protein ACK8P5_16300 [Paenibacillus sp. EC2-1]|uniref:hypothetical protein n=1 Tax=Paenibacillus sp. EC2-1 TaxID=3388665 RepID=UPI003BEEC8A1
MNIGSLIRGLLGEQRAGESKTLDMKPGQVVRGVVMNVSEDGQEAVVQIQGVQVKAKLETPLRAGETALLQVQPPGEEGAVVLKPLSPSANQTLSPSSMMEVLEFVNLPDTKENREMIRGMQSVGIPLTKENIAQFKEMLAVKPPQVSLTEWMESSAIAFHRGLPITPESVKGLYQAVFGPQLHVLLESLENQLSEALQVQISNKGQTVQTAGNSPVAGTNGKNEGMANMAAVNLDKAAGAALQTGPGDRSTLVADSARSGQQALLTKLQSLLSQLRGELAQQGPWAGAATPQPASGAAGSAMPPAAGQAAVATGTAAESAPPPLAQAAQPGEGAAGPSPKPPTHGAEPWVGRLLKLLGAEHEQQVLRGGAHPPAQGAAASTAAAGQAGSPNPLGGGSGTGANIAAEAPREPSAAPAAQGAVAPSVVVAQEKTGTTPVTQAAQRGIQESSVFQPGSPLQSTTQAPQATMAGSTAQVQTANSVQSAAANLAAAANPVDQADMNTQQPLNNTGPLATSSTDAKETLKGLLLQLAASNDIPPALKEAAGQLIQHMTGQQLLLNTDRTAPFAQVTMFIPLHGADGEQTASVHIQSRRGRKGELDATNCRLWFDLDMKHLGPTVIDVHVVDRIVSLNLRNDQPWVSELFESRKKELAAGVESIGYQLLSMKTSPFPEISESVMDQSNGNTASEYTPQTYKGVDYRI